METKKLTKLIHRIGGNLWITPKLSTDFSTDFSTHLQKIFIELNDLKAHAQIKGILLLLLIKGVKGIKEDKNENKNK